MAFDKGIISGPVASWRLQIEKLSGSEKAANTEAFISTAGRQVFEMVKSLGSGAGISNTDRDYAEKVAGGKIELNEASIRKITEIGERVSRATIRRYNTKAGKMPASVRDQVPDLMIEEPGEYVSQKKGNGGSRPSTARVKPRVDNGVNSAAQDMERERLDAGEPPPPSDLPAGTTLYKTLPNGNPVWLLPDGKKREQHL